MIVGSVLYGADRQVTEWVSQQIPVLGSRVPHNSYAALGVIRGGKIVAGVVYHNYRPGIDVEVSVAATSAAWCLPDTMRRLFGYPFEQLGSPHMSAIIAKNNKRCRKLAEGLGFTLYGVAPTLYDGKTAACIYGMFKDDLKIKERK